MVAVVPIAPDYVLQTTTQTIDDTPTKRGMGGRFKRSFTCWCQAPRASAWLARKADQPEIRGQETGLAYAQESGSWREAVRDAVITVQGRAAKASITTRAVIPIVNLRRLSEEACRRNHKVKGCASGMRGAVGWVSNGKRKLV